MSDTKENILKESLILFAQKGYEAVSVSDIVEKVGFTKGALYKHYKNKRDIFDSIVKRMYEVDEKRAGEYDVPKSEYNLDSQAYEKTSVESVKRFTLAQFEFWTEDTFASNFRKMLTLEQYRNPEMAKLYSDCIVFGPVLYTEDIFREMMKNGKIKDLEPRQIAMEFYAPLYLLINVYDHTEDKEVLKMLLKRHVEDFFKDKLL